MVSEGNLEVVLCERGIWTFETYTRNTFDLSAIPVVRRLSRLPVIADPIQGTGIRDLALLMSKSVVAAGADGLIVEVHSNPEEAFSDGPQSLLFEQFEALMGELQGYLKLKHWNL